MKCFSCLLAVVSIAAACQHEIEHVERFHGLQERLVKRQEAAAFPPELDGNEATLINSFEATSIDTWSYYYTHGLHIAGTNRGMLNLFRQNIVRELAGFVQANDLPCSTHPH